MRLALMSTSILASQCLDPHSFLSRRRSDRCRGLFSLLSFNPLHEPHTVAHGLEPVMRVGSRVVRRHLMSRFQYDQKYGRVSQLTNKSEPILGRVNTVGAL